jgi:cell wall-associated NlpC family hydrolase
MRGTDVSVLQAYLTLAGFPTRKTGYFGAATFNGVFNFKWVYKFSPVDGVAGTSFQHILQSRIHAFLVDPPPVGTTRINSNGTATAPVGSPYQVLQVVAAANQIINKPYVYGGGHGSFYASGYDCSGSVSYALHGGGLLSYPEASGALERFGSAGPGRYITVYANASHAFMVVSGRAFDTANFGGPNIPRGSGPRWRYSPTANLYDGTGGYVARHPAGL